MQEYVGIFSWKFPMKTGLSKPHVYYLLKREDVDIISFCNQIPNYLAWTEKQHPGFMVLFRALCSHLGLKVAEPKCVIYSNFFVAKKPVYKAYSEILDKAIEWLERPDIKPIVMKDATYKAGLSKEKLKSYTGLDHYTYHTFLLERLISVYIDNMNLSFKVKNKIE